MSFQSGSDTACQAGDEAVYLRAGYAESSSGPIIKPQFPLVFELINDPNEAWDLIETRLDCASVTAPVVHRLAALQESAVRSPHIKPGEEFAGYS